MKFEKNLRKQSSRVVCSCCQWRHQEAAKLFCGRAVRGLIKPLILLVLCVPIIFAISRCTEAYVAVRMAPHDDTTRRVVCYYRWQINQLTVADLPDGSRCTHILLGFATVGSDFRLNLTDVGGPDGVKTVVSKIRRISSENQSTHPDLNHPNGSRNIRVMLSIGGGGHDNFPPMVSSKAHIDVFLASCADLVRASGLDGIDYDWEFPGFMESVAFARLLQYTSEMLNSVRSNGFDRADLSVALPGPFTLAIGFPVNDIVRYCSFVNLMTYDLVLLNPLFRRTALHSALYPQPSRWYAAFSVDFAVTQWLVFGVDRSMINLGIPTYGVGYELTDKSRAHLFAPVVGYSKMGANINYAKICSLVKSQPNRVHRDEASSSPYLDDGNGTWISYDDPYSVMKKVEFARAQGLGGIMLFSLNADDHAGICGQQKFPLTTTAVRCWWSDCSKDPRNETVSIG